MADLRGRKGYGPPRSIFFHFRVVLGKNYPKYRLAPPHIWGLAPPVWETLDQPLELKCAQESLLVIVQPPAD